MIRFLLIILVFLVSCFPSKEVRRHRRAMRKVEKARYISPGSFDVDTIVVFDTVITRRYAYDTIHSFIKHDTVVVVNDQRAVLKYFYDTTRKEIYHEIECKSDTITKEIPIEVDVLVNPTVGNIIDRFPFWVFPSIIIVLLILVALRIWRPPR